MKRRLVSEDWARVEFYASRVKVLRYFDNVIYRPRTSINPEILQALALRDCENSPFLPVLLDLHWDGDISIFSYMSSFLGPRLARLSLCIPSGLNAGPAVVSSIQTKSPFLRSLFVECTYNEYRDVSDVTNLSKLENLTCGIPLSSTSILHLSRLSTLKDLSLVDHPLVIIRSLNVDDRTSAPPFVHLTSLAIRGWDGPSLIQLLRVIISPQLRRLSITLKYSTNFPNDRDIRALLECHPSVFQDYQPTAVDDFDLIQIFEAVCDSCTSLCTLLINGNPLGFPEPSVSPPNVIRPLLRLTSLTNLDVREARAFDLNDDMLHEMGSAWPSLRCLHIGDMSMEFPRVTLRGFSNLLRRCSQMEQLSIVISVSPDDAKAVLGAGIIVNESMRRLDLGHSKAEDGVDPVMLAGAICGLCPNLFYLYVSPTSGSREAWNVITEWISDN